MSRSMTIQESFLDNGLKILVLPDKGISVATVQVWYRVGSRNEHPGIRGLAHLLEHMMFKGSGRVGPEEHARIIDAVGGYENAFTSEDVTAYYDTVPSDRLELAIELEADRMTQAKLDPSHFFKEREVVKEEIRQGHQNNPVGALLDRFRAEAFTVHPYSWTPGGTLEDLDKITLEDLKAFYRTYYSPSNAVLIVAGDTDLDQVLALARKHMGAIPRGSPVPPVTAVEPAQTQLRRVELRFPTQLPFVVGGYKVPEAAHADKPVLEVISNLLSSGKSSRLHQELVRKSQLAVFAGAWNWKQYDPGLFVLMAGFTPDKQPAEVERALLLEVQRLAQQGPTPEELEKIKNQLMFEYLVSLNSLQQRGFEIGIAETVDRDYRKFLKGVQPYEKIGVEDVRRVVRTYLIPERLTLAVLLPPLEGEQVKKDAPTHIQEAEKDPRSWPSDPRFLQLGAPSSVPLVLPVIGKHALPNGLKVRTLQRSEQPLVNFDLILPGGAILDPVGKAGLASFLTEMLTQGTETRSADALASEIDGLGGEISAHSEGEFLRVQGRFLKRDFARGLELFREVILKPTFPASEMDKIRPQIEAEVRMVKDSPNAMGFETIRYLIYGYDYPRGRSTSLATIAAIGREDLVAMYRRIFQPSGALLYISGDIDPEAVWQNVQKEFSSWAAGPGVDVIQEEPRPLKGRPIRVVDKPDLTQSSLVVGHLGLRRGDPDYVPFILGNYVLGEGGFSSRLMRSLRSKGGKTYGAGSFFSSGRNRGVIAAYTFTRSGETGSTLQLMLDELKLMKEKGVTAEELLAAKNHLAGSYVLHLQPPAGMTEEFLMSEFFGLPDDWVKTYRQRMLAPSLEDVNTVMKARLQLEDLAIVVVGKAAEIKSQLKSFGLPTVVDYLAPVPDEERKPAAPGGLSK